MRRDDGQVRERPFSSLDLELLGYGEREQVPNRGRQNVVVAFEIVALPCEAAERARDVGGDGRLLRDDQTFCHEGVPVLQRSVVAPTHVARNPRTALPAMKGRR